ncbi:N-acyl-phosphatidylethanolamine-hydrolyzing phospholipase D-like [Saccostrea cucullata]|uniref:N-acyl-phosphatidylethanolamine-hydrolyzing phospholipase D-like n=1 Tax=Saccostrea cuccullata TaxID=36930 RepID=UPI002ED29968
MNSIDEELIRPIYKNGRYQNPFDTWEDTPGLRNLFKLMRCEDFSKIPNQRELDKTLPVEIPDFEKLRNPPPSEMQIMWIGHASVLVQMDGVNILTDPIFRDRCSPVQFMGPKRYRPPPCKIEDLPHIDAVIISHNHYDHLDYGSVQSLNSKFKDKVTWFVAVGTKEWMLNAGCQNVIELSWWDEAELPGRPDFKFVSVPCQHRCERILLDTMKALWCSWIVRGPRKSFYFAGDTGYCIGFKQIGRKYGPVDFAAIPIGAYYPRWFMRPMHVNPEEAVKIFEDVRANNALGIHWGTFKMTREFYLEPRTRLEEELDKKSISREKFFTLRHGLVHIVGRDKPEHD